MTIFKLNLTNLGLDTRRRFSSDIIDDYRKIESKTIKNYKISGKSLPELRPKFISVSNGREFYYIIEDIKNKDIDLLNQITQTEEKQIKGTFDITKSKQLFDNEQIERTDNLKKDDSIFKTRLDSKIENIDITPEIKKIKLFFSGRDSLNISIPDDPNEIGAKFILKDSNFLKEGDFVKV